MKVDVSVPFVFDYILIRKNNLCTDHAIVGNIQKVVVKLVVKKDAYLSAVVQCALAANSDFENLSTLRCCVACVRASHALRYIA